MNCHEGFFLARFLEEIIAIKKNFGLLLGYRVHAEEQLQGARATNLPHLHLWYEKKLGIISKTSRLCTTSSSLRAEVRKMELKI